MMLLRALCLLLLSSLLLIGPAGAQETSVNALIARFAEVNRFDQTEALVRELGATGDPAVRPVLEALADGNLQASKAGGAVYIVRGSGKNAQFFDPLTSEEVKDVATSGLRKVKVNNALRRAIRDTLSSLTLRAPNREQRLAAASNMLSNPDAAAIEALDAAIAEEGDPAVRTRMEQARAAAVLPSDLPDGEKIKAIEVLGALGDRTVLSLLEAVEMRSQGELQSTAAKAASSVRTKLAAWDAAQNVWFGISLGSVLLLAAIGLAITFGVMGVINMAHGEMVMLGAYTTFVVQGAVQSLLPGLQNWSLVLAVPIAFVVAGAVGIAIERGIIRFLYGRPLETLLATWGVSLVLQQAVRTIFGPTNREVANPSWMSGSFEVGQMMITWNRLWIVLFALAVFALLLFIINRTPWGLYMRAVTQNRRMAASMGIRTPRVDAFTFGLGSGVAGIAGVALSQIGNVSPNLGQNYIIDSFMVVVFGGVGNLWGTLLGAFSLGIANKFLEPYAGAVLGKIIVLVLIILFIQKRPRGLFALKGRAVES
jgi:urea transport system permease protein